MLQIELSIIGFHRCIESHISAVNHWVMKFTSTPGKHMLGREWTPSELKTDLCMNSLSKDDRQPELVFTLFYLQFITDLKLLWSSSLIS